MRWVGIWIGIFLFAGVTVADDKRDELWKKVEQAIDRDGLPRTAIENLDQIIELSKADNAHDEWIKALGRKYQLEMQLEGGDLSVGISRLRGDLPSMPAAAQPVLKALLANWYWMYYQQNRWRFMERTQSQAPPGDDVTTWDLPRILREVDALFTDALADRDSLQSIPITRYDRLLMKGTMDDVYRPTLYDFLVYEALQFYSLAEQGTRPQGAFDLSADTPVFSAREDFLAWQLPDDPDSPIVKSLRLYQELLAFHAKDTNRAALLDADLARLTYGNEQAFGEEKTARYEAALSRFVEREQGHEVSSLASAWWAGSLHSQQKYVEAREVANQGIRRHPQSVGARLCKNLVDQIEAPQAQITTERVWNTPWPAIVVTYRNVTQVHFRLLAFDVEARLQQGQWSGDHVAWQEREALVQQKPLREWSADLPATTDYQERTESLDIPQDIAPGAYLLLASHDPTFREANNQVSFCEVWVSKLAIVTRTRHGDGETAGMVLDNLSGQPVTQATVQIWVPEERQRRQRFVLHQTVQTDGEGRYQAPVPDNSPYLVLVSHGGHRLSSADSQWSSRFDQRVRPFERTVFFTDRAIYRPGQLLHYKGICLSADQEQDKYQTLASRRVKVVLRDANGEEIESQEHVTNPYGSFSGNFTAPRDRVLGLMTLAVIEGPEGMQHIRVEEYKRPKFFVVADPPAEVPRLESTVTIPGKALSYTGAPIDDALVRYRVVREVRFPDWWFWRCWWWPTDQPKQEIVHGTARTAVDGTFAIEFTAVPDRMVPVNSEPTFSYTVHVDVIDSSGETRSATRTLQAGYTALSCKVRVDEWQVSESPVTVQIATQSLDGDPQAADGILTIHKLQEPDKVHRAALTGRYPRPFRASRSDVVDLSNEPPDWSNIRTWPNGDEIERKAVKIDATGNVQVPCQLPAGAYRASFATQDRFGKSVNCEFVFQVFDANATRLSTRIPDLLVAKSWTLQPGDEFLALWGTGYPQGRALVEVEHGGKIIRSWWTDVTRTQQAIRVPVTDAMRGGFTLHVSHVQENRAYLNSRFVDVPWKNKQLAIRWERFVFKLQPGGRETWTAVVSGEGAQMAAAEMVATLYDASLDAFAPHGWPDMFSVFRRDISRLLLVFQNQSKNLQVLTYGWSRPVQHVERTYRHFPPELVMNYGSGLGGMDVMLGAPMRRARTMAAPMAAAGDVLLEMDEAGGQDKMGRAARTKGSDVLAHEGLEQEAEGGPAEIPAPDPRLDLVAARTNLQETAFFFPHLIADKDGTVRMEFTMPEALTEWKFLGFAHDTDLRSGLLTDKAVTSKDLMVQPLPPRFVREGDVLEFTVKVLNQSPTRQSGAARLTLTDAATQDRMDEQLDNRPTEQSFDIPAGESRSFAWRLTIPDGTRVLTYRAVAASDRLSDGEEGFFPILSRRMLVTESLPLPIRGNQTREFDFARLRDSAQSPTLKHERLELQVTSQPAWYAVLALPYLMEFPHECSEQIFNRIYANALARHIAQSDPRIRRVFDQWRGTDALDSPLLKNEDIKSILIRETPWLLAAREESHARRNVAVLFEQNRLDDELARGLRKLADMQYADGTWPWFPGGPANEFITLYITTGFGRLRHLGVTTEVGPALKALNELDQWIAEVHRRIVTQGKPAENHLTPTICFYLYGRSFFLQDQAIPATSRAAVDYFLGQAREYWVKLGDRLPQGHLALALKRFGDLQTPVAIVKSLRERAIQDDEMGMHWREGFDGWWFHAPVETQALMVEVFDEVAADPAAVEELKIWLLKQKQTQNWKTTKATADAVYAILLRGTHLLGQSRLVEISIAGETIQPSDVEAGTGYFQSVIPAGDIRPEMAQIRLVNPNPGIAWGSVHWQYFEDIDRISAYEGTPLTIKKGLFVKQNTKQGPKLMPLEGPLAVGDELVTRLEVRVDRDMEFVHIQDQRGSGTEPTDVLSEYRFQDGLGYYQSTRDTATHFFIDYLRRGTYVLEYSARVQHRGAYTSGVALLECMYAPEFGGHSASVPLIVK